MVTPCLWYAIGMKLVMSLPLRPLDYIRNSKTIKSVSVSVMFWKLIRTPT